METKIAVFCASSSKADKQYRDAARELASLLVEKDILIQFGGGHAGLMGHLADKALSLGGKIRGFIPKFMVEQGWNHKEVKDMVVVDTMSERKDLIMSQTDGVIALPGGVGTLEELTEAITLKQLGIIDVPIAILNTNGFYNDLCAFFERMSSENLIRGEHRRLWLKTDSPEEAVNYILNSPRSNKTEARNNAAI